MIEHLRSLQLSRKQKLVSATWSPSCFSKVLAGAGISSPPDVLLFLIINTVANVARLVSCWPSILMSTGHFSKRCRRYDATICVSNLGMELWLRRWRSQVLFLRLLGCNHPDGFCSSLLGNLNAHLSVISLPSTACNGTRYCVSNDPKFRRESLLVA